jgi:hypothetical protein
MTLSTRDGGERRWCAWVALALAPAAVAAILTGCGVTTGSNSRGSEFFKELSVTGDMHTGGQLTLDLRYSQVYPVSLNVVCEVLDPMKPTPTPSPSPTKLPNNLPTPTPTPVPIPRPLATPEQRVAEILSESVAPNDAAPTVVKEKDPFDQVTPVVASITRVFTAPDKPGRYIVRCLTPADSNNQIRKTVVIAGG